MSKWTSCELDSRRICMARMYERYAFDEMAGGGIGVY